MKKLTLLLFLFTINSWCQVGKEQYRAEINRLNSLYRVKLDSGKGMLQTEKEQYRKIDSLRISLFETLRKYEKQTGCIEQKEWLVKRKNLADSLWNQLRNRQDIPRDSEMLLYSDLVEFTRARIDCLLR